VFIPLGTKSIRTRFPFATVALIVFNTVVFFLTHPVQMAGEERMVEALVPLVQHEMMLEARFVHGLKNLENVMFGAPSRLRGRTRLEAAFWRDFEAGRVLPRDSEEYVTWQRLQAELRDAEEDQLFWRLGFHRGNPNPLCIVTSLFLHGGALHLIGNMLFLWVVGANMEEVWGGKFFLLLYALGGATSTLTDVLGSGERGVPTIGASGAVAAVMGAFAIRQFHVPIRFFAFVPFGIISVKGGWMLPAWFGLQLHAALTADESASGVAFWAHVGGFALGAGLAWALRRSGVEARDIAPEVERENRIVRKREHLERYARHRERHDAKGMASELDAAIAADPGDVELRLTRFEMLRLQGRAEDAVADGLEVLRQLWQRGDRDRYAGVFVTVDGLAASTRLPAGAVFRAAMALEAERPDEAARLLHRIAQQRPDDPVMPQAMRRYAALLERMGAVDEARAVRAWLEARGAAD
jgi:membrane associated rhomboid family serine protease